MVIFGTALLAACYLAGIWAGEALAVLIGVKANVGGVGIAMIFLIASQHFLKTKGLFPAETEKGVTFWAMMYIPVVVAMAATQNVVVAVKGGPIALLSALGSFLLCFGVVALINRSMQRQAPQDEADASAAGLTPATDALKSR
ncbi:malonate transporter subunit MadL [Xanthobacter oligotrophicus]|uniref:Malonate transporter subunit MadL n=1 Tax=Xanthobacter oligotrophicus TaxID=2607286 RepID=A0ABW6ZWX5_9HYPH